MADIILFSFLLPGYFFSALVFYRLKNLFRPNLPGETDAVFLSSSGSIDDVIKKFGNLESLKEQNPNNFFRHITVCFFPTKKYYKLSYTSSIDIHDFKYIKNLKLYSVFMYFRGVLEITRDKKANLIRALSPYTVGLIGRMVSWIMNIPFCVSLHEDDTKRYRLFKKGGERILFGSRTFALWIRKFVFQSADMVLPIRESLVNIPVNSGVDKNKVCVIPHGIDLNIFDSIPQDREFRKEINPSDKLLIISICRHSTDNYILDVVEIARLLLRERRDFFFLLLGDGATHAEVKEKIDQYCLNDFVQAPGFVPHREAIRYWLAADIALCLMGGYSLIEAALAGKPVVSYEVEWHYELVINGKTGFLVKEHDMNMAAEALRELLDNPVIRNEYGANIKILARQRHSSEITDRIKTDCYRKLLNI